ncbi:Protein of unknown function [Pyronema omphalodes CBS 100304]|uniref:Uncharacterized protein n=1 Tax=Pyronema omphalodes (strain CBS 100304) TaxID=1076935 RepID=U4L6S2_PYROM|nr:Protein of unknown function [Pyronema omphalodes CBS 100304]
MQLQALTKDTYNLGCRCWWWVVKASVGGGGLSSFSLAACAGGLKVGLGDGCGRRDTEVW